MKVVISCLLFMVLGCYVFNAQNAIETSIKADSTAIVDDKYREDQFYLSVTYNLLGNKPDGVSQSGFSSGYHFGFIRDMPINKRRNLALGVGLGFSSNSYNQTLQISENNADYQYVILNDNDIEYTKNKFTTYLIEFPIEFRWRTSTATDYDFWRIYTGVKFGYVLFNSSKFNSNDGDIKLSNIDDFNAFQYGLTFSAGYSNISFHLYYGLNGIFSNAKLVDGEAIDMKSIRIGLMLYIL
ncbi:porin family protein [Psychroserpens ponticola]|uniref:Porin family protein n=1 Tax=Psychroserpens ponticola TaxID=2932268 RepID=A0ABY7RXV5_9FLAO|nr:porin family protein [Psychroserpens ponticola]WCO01976.1 porin family protein [Psychroserpens ponticola]